MLSLKEITEVVNMDFASDAELKEACINVIYSIAHSKPENLSHISFSNLIQFIKKDLSTEQLVVVANYFSSTRVPLFDMHYELIDDNEEIYELEKSTVSEALTDDLLIHPYSLKPVENYKSKIFMYFLPSKYAKELIESSK